MSGVSKLSYQEGVMTENARAKLISKLKETDGRWEATLPAKAGTLYGRRIGVQVETDVPVWEDRSLTTDEITLLTSILRNLPDLLDQAKQAFDPHITNMPGLDNYIDKVRVDICRERQRSDGPERWVLVISFRESDDHEFYVFFDGLRLVEAWGGD